MLAKKYRSNYLAILTADGGGYTRMNTEEADINAIRFS